MRIKHGALSILMLCGMLLLSGCFIMRGVFLGYPDSKDLHRFNSNTIAAGDDCFEFHTDVNEVGAGIKVSDWSSGSPYFVMLDELNESRTVRSMLVIRNDTLLYSYYGQKTEATDLNASYSIAKSFTSALIGIAISEGHIEGVNQKVVDFIPELKGKSRAENLQVEHLLNMTSGIKLKLSTDAKIYYGNDVVKAINSIEFEREPGTYQEYININVQLLGLIIDRATGKRPSEYLSEKIWKPIGMCNDAVWTADKSGNDKTFCCLGATALDYAKFGRLFLHNGSWNGKQVIPQSWVEKTLSRDTANGSSYYYNYLWYVGETAMGDFLANGMYKQHVYVQPKKNVVIVLMCNRDNKLAAERVRWPHVLRLITDQL